MNYKVLVADEAIEDIFSLVKYIHLELCNPDAAEKKYKLGILALLEKNDEFFEYFGKQNDIDENELKEWLLFRKIRESQIYIQRYGITEE